MSTELNVLTPEKTTPCCGPGCCDDTAAEAAAPAVEAAEAHAETTPTGAAIKATVREKYAQIAVGAASSCCDSSTCCTDDISMIGDAYDDVEGYVAEADLGLGCGLPTEYANLQAGQTVLDLGAGAGLDAFVARRIVGEEGRVIGLDMTQEMVDKARANARSLGYDNVDFYLGDIEAMPFENDTVDVVISNCVLNLVPDKKAAFAEMYRVLRSGGRLAVSDWLGGEPPYSAEMQFWLDTAHSGFRMQTLDATVAMIEATGFVEIEARDRNAWYRTFARREVEELQGPKREQLVDILGEAGAEAWIDRMDRKAKAVEAGDLRPGHLRARKPASS